MCKGSEENPNNDAFLKQQYDHSKARKGTPSLPTGDSSSSSEDHRQNDGSTSFCELCGSDASLYCPADDAYLCGKCDGGVHGANFLASRHVRCVLCRTCRRFTATFLVGTSKEARVLKVAARGKKRPGRWSHFCDGGIGEKKCCSSSSRALKRPLTLFL